MCDVAAAKATTVSVMDVRSVAMWPILVEVCGLPAGYIETGIVTLALRGALAFAAAIDLYSRVYRRDLR